MADETPVRAFRDLRREQPHLLDYLHVLLRRKYLVVFVFVDRHARRSRRICGRSIPIYEASARSDHRAANARWRRFRRKPSDQTTIQQDFQTHYQLLQSRNLARKTIDTLGLWGHPGLNPALRPPDDSVYAQVRTQARAIFRMITRRPQPVEATEPPPPTDPPEPQPAELQQPAAPVDPSASPDADVLRTQDRIINAFLANLAVMPVQNSRLLDVSFRSTDPALAATVVNGLASTYIAEDVDTRSVDTRETSAWLTEQIEEQRKLVAAAEDALQRYRERTGDVTVESGSNIVVQKLGRLERRRDEGQDRSLEREAIYRQVCRRGQPAGSADRAFPQCSPTPSCSSNARNSSMLLREEAQLGRQARRSASRDDQGAPGDQDHRGEAARRHPGRRAVAATRLRVGDGAGEQPDAAP